MAELSIQRKKLSVLMSAKATARIPKDSIFPLRKNCRDLAQLSILSIFLTKKPVRYLFAKFIHQSVLQAQYPKYL